MTRESHLTDGLLTDQILTRAIKELQEVKGGIFAGAGGDLWLRECERRLDNALRDVRVSLERFKKAQT